MQFSLTFRQMDATEALKSYARDRLGKIKKYFPDPISCNVVMSTERHHHRVDVNVMLHNGFRIAGHETTENMYSSLDLVAAKIERQVRRYKDKLREHKPRKGQPLAVTHSVFSEPEARPAEDTEILPPIVKREQIHAAPMTVSEAIMQLNLVHQEFLVFLNDDNGQISVLYRRDDDEYGLLETGVT